jgi:hypothetical protein
MGCKLRDLASVQLCRRNLGAIVASAMNRADAAYGADRTATLRPPMLRSDQRGRRPRAVFMTPLQGV